VIAKIRQIGQNGSQDGSDSHFTIETLPKVGFRLIVPERLSSEKVNGEAPAPAAEPNAAQSEAPLSQASMSKRRLLFGVGLAAFVAVVSAVAVLVWPFETAHVASPPDRIVLAPFQTLLADPALQRLARSAHEAVARQMTILGFAPVRAGADVPFEITGKFDREGDSYVAKISIDDRRSGAVLWSRRYDRPAREEAGFDELVAAYATSPLRCIRELNIVAQAMENPILSLIMSSCTASTSDHDIAVTKRLVDAAPDLPAAHALRAWALAGHGSGTEQREDEARALEAEIRASVARALALDPNSAVPHLALGIRFGPAPRFAEREQHLLRALAISPDFYPAQFAYILLLREVGRLQNARDIAYRIAQTDQHARLAVPHLAFFHAMMGDREAAGQITKRIEQFSPEEAPGVRWMIAVWWGDSRKLGPDFWRRENGARLDTQVQCLRDYISRLNNAGRPLRGLPASCTDSSMLPVDWLVRMLSRQGDVDGAYAMIAANSPDHTRWGLFLFYPEMKAFRQDPRFFALAERLGLVAYWRETGHWPDFCKTESPPYPCR
jgi:hypothetical protein